MSQRTESNARSERVTKKGNTMRYSIRNPGTDQILAKHTSLYEAIKVAIAMHQAEQNEFVVRDDMDNQRPCAKIHTDGGVMVNAHAAERLWGAL